VPDIKNDDLATFVKYLVYHAVITSPDPVQVFGTGKLVCIVWDGLFCQVFNMLKNVRYNFFGNFFKILFSALFKRRRLRIHGSGSHHAFLQLGKAGRAFVPPLGNHCEIVKVFPQVLVFPDREDYCDLVAVLVSNILFRSWHTDS
jgi:hypothetical protein